MAFPAASFVPFLGAPAVAAGFFAYIDPGVGSVLIQCLIAGVVGAAFAVKLFWRNIKAFFSRSPADEPPEPEGQDEES